MRNGVRFCQAGRRPARGLFVLLLAAAGCARSGPYYTVHAGNYFGPSSPTVVVERAIDNEAFDPFLREWIVSSVDDEAFAVPAVRAGNRLVPAGPSVSLGQVLPLQADRAGTYSAVRPVRGTRLWVRLQERAGPSTEVVYGDPHGGGGSFLHASVSARQIEVAVVDPSTGRVRVLTRVDHPQAANIGGTDVSAYALTGDGRHLLVVNPSAVTLWDIAAGTRSVRPDWDSLRQLLAIQVKAEFETGRWYLTDDLRYVVHAASALAWEEYHGTVPIDAGAVGADDDRRGIVIDLANRAVRKFAPPPPYAPPAGHGAAQLADAASVGGQLVLLFAMDPNRSWAAPSENVCVVTAADGRVVGLHGRRGPNGADRLGSHRPAVRVRLSGQSLEQDGQGQSGRPGASHLELRRLVAVEDVARRDPPVRRAGPSRRRRIHLGGASPTVSAMAGKDQPISECTTVVTRCGQGGYFPRRCRRRWNGRCLRAGQSCPSSTPAAGVRPGGTRSDGVGARSC